VKQHQTKNLSIVNPASSFAEAHDHGGKSAHGLCSIILHVERLDVTKSPAPKAKLGYKHKTNAQ